MRFVVWALAMENMKRFWTDRAKKLAEFAKRWWTTTAGMSENGEFESKWMDFCSLSEAVGFDLNRAGETALGAGARVRTRRTKNGVEAINGDGS